MSHIPQRKEKDCLNCGTIVQGKYCHVCGQENVVPKETFWHMVTHFFYDITHFDSNFFTTVKDLIIKPGFLPREYVSGRRASYLHPIRMYVFTSAIFFLMLFSFASPNEAITTTIKKPVDNVERAAYIKRLQERLKKDSTNQVLLTHLARARDTSEVLLTSDILEVEGDGLRISLSDTRYRDEKEYDSMQNLLPREKRDGWFKRRLIRKEIDLNQRYREDQSEALKKLGESLLHRLPYMLFVSLPLFAFILKLAYIRRKQYFFVDHGVFTIHLYVFTFLILMVVFAVNKLDEWFKMSWTGFLLFLLFLALYFYLYKAMRNFYKQRRAKTFFKFLFVALASLIMFVILFAIFMFFSAYTL